ncbi:MAG: hypothetical protein Q8M08_16855 [Bacteroidales bacterium]|nr:hypothetical protein [Bacteroidales bacterium]
MKYLYKFTPEIILLIYVLIFLGFKTPEKNWDRVINSDGKGYYAYLPAVFIYHDLQFKFVEQYEAQYYPPNRSVFKEFRNDAGTQKVNKYFPGMAILWLPFFLFGHLLAWLEVYPLDGYSLPYQYSIAISALLFLWLGARWLQKLLKEFGSDDRTSAFITLAITLGTNLIFFTVVEPSMTHVYSFALITGFALTIFKLFHEYQPKWFVKSLLLFTLIFLIRPTNLVILLLVPFIAGNREVLFKAIRQVIPDKKTLVRGSVQAALLLAVPVILWYLQTGKPFVYTYGDEKLNLFQPHMLNILFSFNRGWFIYTPIAFISIFGFAGLFAQNRNRFYWLMGFLVLFIYVASCWWVWYYASKCGQRVFIDIYVVVALLLVFLFKYVKTRTMKRLFSAILVLLISLNLLQFYQHATWIFPPYNINGAIYKSSFFSLTRKARTFISDESIAGKITLTNDMETDRGIPWMNAGTRNDTIFRQGRWSSKIGIINPYSVGLEDTLNTYFSTTNRVVLAKAWVLSPKETTEATLVVDYQSDGRSLSYNQFLLDKFVPADKWTRIEAAFYVPGDMPSTGMVKVYFYNPSPLYKLYIDDLAIDFISLKNEPDYRKLEGVFLPEKVY